MKKNQAFSQYFREVQPKFARLCASHLSRLDLTMPQFSVLSILNTEGAVPMTELSDRLHITKPAVTNLVDRLEENGFIKRRSDAKDRRVYLIEIEPKGKKFVAQMQTTILGILLSTLNQFSDAEKNIVTRFYASLSSSMDQYFAKNKRGK